MIVIEQATRMRHCFECGREIPPAEWNARIWGSSRTCRCYCVFCVTKGATRLVQMYGEQRFKEELVDEKL